jgi:pyruvate formate lyase activating enzyme
MQINGFNKTTLLDYPKHLAATIFLGGCDFRCPFCHNASLVLTPLHQPIISEEDVISFLKKRSNILEGVCITGGEPTLHNELPLFIEKIKNLGLKVKLDTNGNNPNMLQKLLDLKLLDYIAMDIKNSREKYTETIGLSGFTITNVDDSIQLIKSCGIDYEFRTTAVKEFHEINDFIEIGKWIHEAKLYYIQSYIDSGDTISTGFSAFSKIELDLLKSSVAPFVNFVDIRGVD